jgi:hypothetical protein
MLFYFPAHTLDSSEQDRRQRKELIFSLIVKSPCLYKGFLCHFIGEDVGNNQNIFESLDDRNKRS